MKGKLIKVLDEYRADEFGLPVLIRGVPIVEIDGEEVVDIDYDKISELLFAAMILKPAPLTGAEVRFMRLFMGLTLESLAAHLHVTHPTILSWEKCGNEPTKMTDSTEAMLRIFAAHQGANDSELIGIILNNFYHRPQETGKATKWAAIVEVNADHLEEPPKVHFSDQEEDLRLLREA